MRRATDLVTRLQARQANDKSLGQHFLIEEAHLEAIVSLAGDLEGRVVLEVGPGPGTLTEHLLRSGAIVHAIEIDAVAVGHLRDTFAEDIASQALMLHEGDALTAPWPDHIDAVVSNIPYQISSPLIGVLEKHRWRHSAPEVVVLLVQEEFAERLTLATPADRGSLGVCTALGWSSIMDRRVPPGSFRPPPAVMSGLRLTPHRPARGRGSPLDPSNGACSLSPSTAEIEDVAPAPSAPVVSLARLARNPLETRHGVIGRGCCSGLATRRPDGRGVA
tara:strand:- start:481 stop:1308 length:828 start_codon:yes stop_codon:yes gene_type:complete